MYQSSDKIHSRGGGITQENEPYVLEGSITKANDDEQEGNRTFRKGV